MDRLIYLHREDLLKLLLGLLFIAKGYGHVGIGFWVRIRVQVLGSGSEQGLKFRFE